MLIAAIERYLALRRSLGFKLREASQRLQSFGRFAMLRGDTHVRAATAIEWATAAPSPNARRVHLEDVVRLARFLRGEDAVHEVPPENFFHAPRARPLPYIYSPEQIARIVKAARRLRESYPLRRQTYPTPLGLIAATGVRISEALDLRLSDILPEGALRIQRTKFNKIRLVPLHPTVIEVLNQYLVARCKLAAIDDHVFLSAEGRRIHHSIVNKTFRRILQLASVSPGNRHPRIHDLRHTFVIRALEKCATQQKVVSRHFVALATYVGHADIADTYWYLAATPELMAGIATTTEALVAGEGV
jgi:integrase/recombinase XerD